MKDRIDVHINPSGEGYEWFVLRVVPHPSGGDWGSARVAEGWCRTEMDARMEANTVAVREMAGL